MADGTAVAQIAHEDAGGVLRYTVTAFDTIRTSDVQLMRWDLDLDGDGSVTGRNDGCVVLRPVKGRRLLRADLYRGCTGDPVVSSDGRPKGNTLKVRLLLEEVRNAGLSDDATGYAYRFRAVANDGSSDEVPDAPGELIMHTLGASGSSTQDASEPTAGHGSSEDIVVGDASTTAGGQDASDTAVTAAKQRKKDRDERDTTSTGTAEDEVVEPGDDVGIRGSGFASNQPLEISLAGARATSTATQSPSPSPSASPTSTPAGTQNVSAQDVNAAGAGATQIGIAMSDDEGNLDDDVNIPDETNPGDYTIRAVGRNATGGTHIVTIPIKVAAGVEEGSSADDVTAGQVTNATGTATQAPTAAPVNTTATTGTTLPKTGSSQLTLLAGLGTIGVVLGGSMVFARRRIGTAGIAGAAPMPLRRSGSPAAVFDFSGLRGEMQRLLALRAHRYDPDRDADL